MQVTLQARLPAEDAAQRALFASPGPGPAAPAQQAGPAPAGLLYPGGNFRSEIAVARRLAHLDGLSARADLREFLLHENAFAPLAPEQRANLDAAASDQAVFVLTGQQPGLLGGPMLWYYKALTCAALAKEWAQRLGRPVIPIFWVAGDDADLRECNHVELLDRKASEVRSPLSLPFADADRPLTMGERRVADEALNDLFKRLGTIWSADAVEAMRRAYPAPSTLSSGFLRLAQSLLGREGILFVDGYSKHLRALARPVLARAVERREEYHALLKRGTAAAASAGIPEQVELRSGVVHAFVLDQGMRRRLLAERSRAGEETVYIAERPNHNLRGRLDGIELTHDVFTRPLVADSVFPVLGHVLGPAELRYFAQLAPLFLEATGDMPLLHPRMTVAAAPAQAFSAFASEGLDLSEAVRFGPSALRARIMDRLWRAHPAASALSLAPAERWLEALAKTHARHFKDAGPMDRLQGALGAAWKRYARSLEKAVYGGEAQRKQPLFDHLRWLGNGMGQDRHLTLGSLLNEIGKDGLAALRQAVDPLSTDLQIVMYGGG